MKISQKTSIDSASHTLMLPLDDPLTRTSPSEMDERQVTYALAPVELKWAFAMVAAFSHLPSRELRRHCLML